MAVPKKKSTHKRRNNRRNQKHGKVELKQAAVCSNCGASVAPHKICAVCGYYKGKKILPKLI